MTYSHSIRERHPLQTLPRRRHLSQIVFLLCALGICIGATWIAADEPAVPAKPSPGVPVHMLIPGYTVQELPVELPNINNLRYRADGQLVALGYGGDIWLLRDSDEDGLEDQAALFFDGQSRLRGPIGMAVIPRHHALLTQGSRDAPVRTANPSLAQGVVVASKGKVSAVIDWDGDNVADEERVLASGWKEIPPNVDTIGVAIDASGAIYFGLGTAAYDNPYQIDPQGKAHYDLASERGTIQRIEPDLARRSTVCTGVRFTIGMGFDEHGELFVTDQEGATWLADGNPLDELLHIPLVDGLPKRHYGFPPRHPKHLPHVMDEPSLFQYAPQHQSTCGLAFNLPRTFSLDPNDQDAPPHQALFGPDGWRGDVFVAGESRGKLYRTELARTERGQYVARNHLIACLGMLTVDCCISPRGDLVVCCHSGDPDWGTGPTGQGKLFAIRYIQPQAQPIMAWSAGPQEVRVAMDRPLAPEQLTRLAGKITIRYGEFVAAGDRFESLRPGYEVVQRQLVAPRHELAVHGISVTSDRRTLVLATAPHHEAVTYSLTCAAPSGDPLDLAYSLQGVLASWEPDDRQQPAWRGVLPHLDFDVCRAFSARDLDAERFEQVLAQEGTLTLRTQLDLRDLLHPAVQPGSQRDEEWPDESIRIRLEIQGAKSLAWQIGDVGEEIAPGRDGWWDFNISSLRAGGAPVQLTLVARTGKSAEKETGRAIWGSIVWIHPDDDARLHELPLNRLLLPWADFQPTTESLPARRELPELAGGSWGRGRQVFYSDDAACAKCHVPQGSDGAIGPDLSNLVHRDLGSVLRDVTHPSATINPDYFASVVALQDGRVLTGTVRTKGDQLLIGDREGNVHLASRDEVVELQPSPLSAMPEGLPQTLGAERMRDLLTFLLTEPPHMPRDGSRTPPLRRQRSEIARVLAIDRPEGERARVDGHDYDSPVSARVPRPIRILLVAGPKDHGPGEHDYPAWLRAWGELLQGAAGVTVETAWEWPTAEQFAAADTAVFYQKGTWNEQRAQAVDAHLARGGGLVFVHWAIEGGDQAPAFAERIGLAADTAKTAYRHGPLELSFGSPGSDHPIGRNFDQVRFYDESYWHLQGDPSRVQVLASGIEEGEPRPLFWTATPVTNRANPPGRVFVSVLGHYSATFDDPLFRILLLRGIAWSAREPVDRWNELATIGVTLAD